MKILVTGGAGFIGTNFVYFMAGKGHEIIVLDKLTYAGGRDNLAPLKDKVELFVGDICDRAMVKETLKNIDVVIHFAAESHNTRSEHNPEIFYKTNVDGTKVMLEEAKKANISKFIHISTDEVYGSKVAGQFGEDEKILGDSQATSAYSKSKSLSDDVAMKAGRNQPVVVARITNNFGPWQYPEKALPRWITNLLTDKKIPLWGEGLQVRDWLYVQETARAIDFLISNGEDGQAYNIAANNRPEITNLKAAEILCNILKKDSRKNIDFIEDPRPNHDFRYALDTSKIEDLGWKTDNSIYDQFKKTVNWYLENRKWWEKRKASAEEIYR